MYIPPCHAHSGERRTLCCIGMHTLWILFHSLVCTRCVRFVFCSLRYRWPLLSLDFSRGLWYVFCGLCTDVVC